jgi:alkanesulfonate monooxygenase SsuD/methylene tetrahydromethanopterin reductase-like flavin-dependent oxidoreductase (luciferase family)
VLSVDVTIEIGVLLPTSTPDPAVPIIGDIKRAARSAEELGLDSVWSTDHLIASAPLLDSTTVLGTAAGATERIRIGYGVLLLSLRPVAWAAKQISTLQHVSGGRLEVGVGTGNTAHGDLSWRASGQSFADRGARTDASLRLLPGLIAGEPTTLPDGTEVTLAPGASVPPILVAGDAPRARRRAAEFGDGWIGIGTTAEETARVLAELAELAAEYGRPAPYAVIVAPPVAEDPKQAAEQLAGYAEVGVRRVVLTPRGADWHRTYEDAAAIRASLGA